MRTLFICFVFVLTQPVAAQQKKPLPPLSQRIAVLQQNIARYFYDSASHHYKEHNYLTAEDKKKYAYLWPLCALIQAANEVQVVQPKSQLLPQVLHSIQAYYDNAPPAPAYNSYVVSAEKDDRFYDDNQWIGIACMDAFVRTKDSVYLKQGLMAYQFMMTAFDTVAGGGLYWKEKDYTTKNTCSNGPGAVLALQLYAATKNKAYLDTAQMLLRWVDAKLLSPEGVYYDHVQLPARTIDKRRYTYNTGTMLESYVLLYELLGDKKYLTRAQKMAADAYKYFYKGGRWPSHYWFNVVLLRGYLRLAKHDANKKYINSFRAEGDRIWQQEKDKRHLIGTGNRKALIDQAAMLEWYARLAQQKNM